MSLFTTAEVTCGACGKMSEVSRAASINADRRDDLRQAILDGSFQAEACPHCGERMRLPAQLSYLDIGRGQWIIAEDTAELETWREAEARAQTLFDTTFGRAAPPLERELGSALAARVVFGWPALREKLLCGGCGLDDLTLELLKLAIMREVPGSPLADDTELRLVEASDQALEFAWLRVPGETGLASVSIERGVYDHVAQDAQPWTGLRTELQTGLFVDVKRLFLN
jgi:hypothetical protein